MYIGNNGTASIQLMNDSLKRFYLDKDSEKKQWEFINQVDTNCKFTLHYQKSDSNTLQFTGLLGKDSLYLKLNKLPSDNYLLMKRGFHWINEFTYNR